MSRHLSAFRLRRSKSSQSKQSLDEKSHDTPSPLASPTLTSHPRTLSGLPPPAYSPQDSAPTSPTSFQRATLQFPPNPQDVAAMLSSNSPHYAAGGLPPNNQDPLSWAPPNTQPVPPTFPPNPQVPMPYVTRYDIPPSNFASPPTDLVDRRYSFRDNREVGASHYEGLARFDTVFLIDDSGSMSGANWRQTSAALEAIVPICTAHDSDGVDIYFLNNPIVHTNIRSSAEVLSIFSNIRPAGATPTGKRLGELFALYLKSYRRNQNIKPMNIIVITDGEPTDPQKLEKVIVNTAKELDNLEAQERQIGVQFFQVGSDEAATESLEELDNSLVEEWGVRDMVDTVSWKKMNEGNGLSADGILKVVMGAVDKHLDRKRKF